MTNKRIVYALLTVAVLAVIAALFIIAPKRMQETGCAEEGETIGAQGMPELCCPGLNPMGGWPGGYVGDCSLPPPPTGLSLCSNCGNGMCDVSNGENKCNCPEDCE